MRLGIAGFRRARPDSQPCSSNKGFSFGFKPPLLIFNTCVDFPLHMKPPDFSRRSFLSTLGGGFGSLMLADLLASQTASADAPRRVGPHFAPKAKRIILLFMTGGPSHMDMFDPKPALEKYAGQRPAEVELRTERKTGGLLPSPFKFQKYGKSGIEVSELLPKLAATIDDLCVIRSLYSFNPNHEPGRNLFFSGIMTSMRPTIGAWVSYGLGTENQNLPAFVVLSPSPNSLWTSSGFLPAEYQGTLFNNAETDPEKMIRFLRNKDLDATAQRAQLDTIQALNRAHADSFGADDFLEGRIKSMETAYRMQFTASDVFDIRKEPESVRAEYGNTPYAIRQRLSAGATVG